MLHNITIENFFSIADKQELVFAVSDNAPALSCFRKSLSNDEIRLPTVIGFFGANASGKSTLLRAVVNTALFVCNSFVWEHFLLATHFQAYRQKDWWGKPTKIIIDLDSRLKADSPVALFRYELHIKNNPDNLGDKTVSYEALSYAPQGKFRTLFERDEQKIKLGREFGEDNDQRKNMVRSDASILSTFAAANHEISKLMVQAIASLQTNIGFDKIKQSLNQWLSIYANDKNCLDRINKELRRCDVGIESMVVEQNIHGFTAKFEHTGLDSHIFLEEESEGTQKFIAIFPRIHYALQTGSVAIIDEMDTDLHPLLLPELFRWFGDQERNPYGAQLIMTAHNPAILDELEKEQVFFTEKPSGKPTRIYGARQIKGLRREPSLMRKYLAGELGAIPHIG